MSKIVFFTWSGGGNQPPATGLAQQLRRRGHDIVIAGYPNQASRFEALGFEFATLTRSASGWAPFNPATLMALLADRVWSCPDHIADTADVLDRHRPDLVVVDCLMGGVLAAMEASPIPAAVLVHSAPGALAPLGGPLDAMVRGALNPIRSTLHLPAVDSLQATWHPHHVICASIPELDPQGDEYAAPATWIGPVFEDPTPTDWTPGASVDTPLVLVSFTSTPAWDQTSRIQRTVDGLADEGVRVLVTAGSVDPSRIDVPSTSVTVVPYLPHCAVLPHAAAVVTHAGHGTLTAALAHGLPVVTLPNLAADQPALAVRAAQLGAGIHLDDDTATAAEIARAVRSVLDEPGYATSAQALARRMADYRDQPVAALEAELNEAAPTIARERVSIDTT